MSGAFITLEGGEGSGKSTQSELLCMAFAKASLPHINTREPGGSQGAERIRSLLVTGEEDAWDADTETVLFYAARLDHLNCLVRPALTGGKYVICDRFADSTRVYQGIGKGISDEYINMLHHMILGNFQPNLTLLFDIDPKLGLKRAGQRKGDETRFESMDIEFHQRIRAGFMAIAAEESERCVILDASQDKIALHQQVIEIVNTRLGLTLTAIND